MRKILAELRKEMMLQGSAAEQTDRTADGVPVWMDAIRDKVYDCEALDIHSGEEIPLMGYRYQLEEHGKWGFISPGLACVTPAIYDGIVASENLVAAWTYAETESRMDLTVSLKKADAETGETEIWLRGEEDDLPYPLFRGINEWLRPERTGMLSVRHLEGDRIAYLYQIAEDGDIGLLQIYENGRRKSWHAYYRDGILAVTEPGSVEGYEIHGGGCTLDLCLLAIQEDGSHR